MTFEATAAILGLPNLHYHLYMKSWAVSVHALVFRAIPHMTLLPASLDLLVHPATPPSRHASLGDHGGFIGNVSRLQVKHEDRRLQAYTLYKQHADYGRRKVDDVSASRLRAYPSYMPPSSADTTSSRSTPKPSLGRSNLSSSSGSSGQRSASYSYDLFNVTPDAGLVHQRSSEQDDLDDSRSRPRTSTSSDTLRKYVCPECGKRFAKPSTLKVSSESPFMQICRS
jgi:hypothetical protein